MTLAAGMDAERIVGGPSHVRREKIWPGNRDAPHKLKTRD